MLYASTKELEDVCTDLKARYDEIDGEENDWKTRCEHQEQMNRQFSEQIEQLQSQLLQYEILLKGDMSSSSPENVDKLLGITEVSEFFKHVSIWFCTEKFIVDFCRSLRTW